MKETERKYARITRVNGSKWKLPRFRCSIACLIRIGSKNVIISRNIEKTTTSISGQLKRVITR